MILLHNGEIMPHSNPLDILLIHNHWANRKIIEACAPLTPEQFHRTFEMGRGSVHNTIAHILGAMRAWNDMLNGREPGPRVEAGPQHTCDELLALLEEITADLNATARALPLDEIVSAVRGGKKYTLTRGGVLTHVTTHGMHHRAQCLNMLRQLGVSPLPAPGVIDWIVAKDMAE
jgi:uncharacterized damage-inducible protein DinB